MFYIILLAVGFALFPCVHFLCRLLDLDEVDSHIMFLVSMPIAGFVLILGFWGACYK